DRGVRVGELSCVSHRSISTCGRDRSHDPRRQPGELRMRRITASGTEGPMQRLAPGLLVAASLVSTHAFAQSAPPAPAAQSHLDEEDTTGTNPAKFTRTLILLNELRSLGEEAAFDEAMFRYIQPF